LFWLCVIPSGYHTKKKWTQILTLAKSPWLRAFVESAPCEAEPSAGPYSGKASGGGGAFIPPYTKQKRPNQAERKIGGDRID
jgi:hypothetical protein